MRGTAKVHVGLDQGEASDPLFCLYVIGACTKLVQLARRLRGIIALKAAVLWACEIVGVAFLAYAGAAVHAGIAPAIIGLYLITIGYGYSDEGDNSPERTS